jgi:hypothetical protein
MSAVREVALRVDRKEAVGAEMDVRCPVAVV